MISTPSSFADANDIAVISFQDCHRALLEKTEIALLDVREEAPFAEAHPLFAANLPISHIEADIAVRIPRRDTTLAIYDNGEGLALKAARRLVQLGYTAVHLLEGGLQGWRDAGGEIFIDVNTPSKAFGELVESQRHTPSLSAQEVDALLTANADVVILDARRFDEYNTMSIPRGVSVPGAELVLRARELAPRPQTRIIVNCAGRTRSIIGTQSLINANIPNPVSALRNGTIGWTLAGQKLETGKTRTFADVGPVGREHLEDAQKASRALADRASVVRIEASALEAWRADASRTTYLFDVRTPEEYASGHVPDFRCAPGGQLVQETDHHAPVRGARIVLADDDGVRANMTGSWLAQLGWQVAVLDGLVAKNFHERSAAASSPEKNPDAIASEELATLISRDHVAVLDVGASANYVRRHIAGAWFVLRSQLADALTKIPRAQHYVLVCETGLLSQHAVADLRTLLGDGADVRFLAGGTAAWGTSCGALQTGETALASPRIDRYRRPYEGTDNPLAAMQAYLDWEYGLVAQLARDGTHGFFVV
ncbi:MAG: Rhodanese-like sulfurtransferase [Herbaspirillum sp.]|nr:Rhodanese-like sulfurtransferase [Herbaspirillum sp.]